jgi:L-fucose isomerase-like protein
MRNIKAAFIGFGEINSPREVIHCKCEKARKLVADQGIDLVWTEPVSDDPLGHDVARAKMFLANTSQDFDLIIICIAGWIPSHAVIDIIEPFRHKPILLWGLTGWEESGRFLTTADQAGTAALRKPMEEMGYNFKYVYNCRGCPAPLSQIVSYAQAARAASLLRGARIGQMGYRDMRLFGTQHDGISLRGKVGPDVEVFEMLEIEQIMKTLAENEIKQIAAEVRNHWKFVKPPKADTVENAVRLYLALRQKICERSYEAFSYMDVDGVKKLWHFAPAGALMLLHENLDICTIPENDTLGAVTQLMTRFLTNQVAAYMEFYEFLENGVLIGVPDYVPPQVVEGVLTVMPTAFGEFGEGLLNVSKVKTGKVTLARLTCTDAQYQLHLVTGEATTPQPWEEAGWTPPAPQLPSLEICFDKSVDDFAQNVMGQHYILSYGDNTAVFRDFCRLIKIDVIG